MKDYYQWHLVVYHTHHLLLTPYSSWRLWMFISGATEDSPREKGISLDILVTTATHIIHITVSHTKLSYKYRNIFFQSQIQLHFTICVPKSTYTDANITWISWCQLTYSYV
jgi:hypothetical protein